jgi:hypothetical protein
MSTELLTPETDFLRRPRLQEHKLIRESDFEFAGNEQMWCCCECREERQWGFNRPWDSLMRPALKCNGCQAVTRHKFTRLAR